MMPNQNTVTNIVRAIVATAFLSAAVILPQAGFSQQSPGAVGDPRVDEPNNNSQVNDPSRPVNEQNNTSGPNAGSNSNTSMPDNQMNNSGYGSGSGSGGIMMDRDSDSNKEFSNRIEKYTNDPNATNTRRNMEYLP